MSKGELRTGTVHAARVHSKVQHHRLQPRWAVAVDAELSDDSCHQGGQRGAPREREALPRDRSDPERSFLPTKLPFTCSNHPHTIHMDVQGMARHG